MSNQKSFGLSIDVKEFVRHLLTDPSATEQLYQAIDEGEADSKTQPLGACNLGTMEDQSWFTIFMANSKEVESGQEGYLIRPRSDKSKGRIILNLREQTKDHEAVVKTPQTLGTKMGQKAQSTAPAPSNSLTDDQRQRLLAKLNSSPKSEKKVASEVPAEAQRALQG